MDATAPGALEAMASACGAVFRYLLMQGPTMVAMVYPSSTGAFQWYADLRGRLQMEGVAALVGAYTLLWLVVRLVPPAVDGLVGIARRRR